LRRTFFVLGARLGGIAAILFGISGSGFAVEDSSPAPSPEVCGLFLAGSTQIESFEQFLRSTRRSASLIFGAWTMRFRRQDWNFMSSKTGMSLALVDVNSDQPGSKQYLIILRQLEQMARDAGYVTFIVEGVSNPRQWAFYENKAGYLRYPRDEDHQRTYYLELN
jgi:hypothetical protein